MSDGIVGFGATLQLGSSTNSSDYTNIGNVTRITGPSIRRGVVDISTMDSTGGWQEFKPAMIDPGEMTFELNYVGETATAKGIWLHNLLTATAYYAKLWLNDHATASQRSSIACAAFLVGKDMETPMDGKVANTITLKFTGAPTVTAHA